MTKKFSHKKLMGLITGHPDNFLSQNVGHIFFKFYMVKDLKGLKGHFGKDFQNAQTLAFWLSEWKVMTVWRYFFGQFLTKNRVNLKKIFLENKKFGISKI
jgi:hypothetical protein